MKTFALQTLALGVFAIAAVASSLQSQAPASRLSFEVASVKPSKSTGESAIDGSPNRFVATGIPLRFLMREAYGVRDFQILDGPDWINTDRWDIEGKAGEGTKGDGPADPSRPAEMGLMLQALLEERFELKFHREVRELPVYELAVAKGGPKIRLSPDQSPPIRPTEKSGPPRPGEVRRGGMRMGRGEIEANAWTVMNFTNLLSQQMDRTLVDKTNLVGLFDFKLKWGPGFRGSDQLGGAPPPQDEPEIFTAIQEQLGLKVESAKGPVEILVIDSVQKPTEN